MRGERRRATFRRRSARERPRCGRGVAAGQQRLERQLPAGSELAGEGLRGRLCALEHALRIGRHEDECRAPGGGSQRLGDDAAAAAASRRSAAVLPGGDESPGRVVVGRRPRARRQTRAGGRRTRGSGAPARPSARRSGRRAAARSAAGPRHGSHAAAPACGRRHSAAGTGARDHRPRCATSRAGFAPEVRRLRPVPRNAVSDTVEGPRWSIRCGLPCLTRSAESVTSYGGRCTPASVTIAVISSAGVTSNAGLRAGKRSVTSAGSRSSIGIPAPVGVARSTVEVGATT